MEKEIKRISFSELKNWAECPYRHKLIYIDKMPAFSGNEYTAFGSAIHKACEEKIQNINLNIYETFLSAFENEINALRDQDGYIENKNLTKEMKQQAKILCKQIIPAVEQHFGEYEVFSVEEQLLEQIDEIKSYGRRFKGFIDLVLKTPDEKYHIIDWKTCSWGWNSKKKSEPLTTYQLTYYKNYFSKKHGIDKSKIETYFALLKRTAKKENVEIFRVTSGQKKTTNALKLLENAVINIERENYIKNKLSCKYCKFYNTEHCP